MKCTNCGFDAENNAVCPVCGHDLAGEAQAQNPAPQGTPYQQAQPDPYQNPYVDRQAPAPQQPRYDQPYIQQPQNPYAQPQNVQPQNPYAQPQNVQPQRPQPYIQPQAPAPAQNPNQIPNQIPYQPKPKKSNAGIIVLLCVVGSVILIGIFLAVFSNFLFSGVRNISERIEPVEETLYESDDDDWSVIDFGEKIDVSGITAHKIGESVDFEKSGTLTLSKVEKSGEQSSVTKGYTNYKVTLVIKNNTGSDIDPTQFSVEYYDAEGNNLGFATGEDLTEKVMFLYSDYDVDYTSSIAPGKSWTQVDYISVKDDVTKVYAGCSTLSTSMLGGDTEQQYYEFDFSEIK